VREEKEEEEEDLLSLFLYIHKKERTTIK